MKISHKFNNVEISRDVDYPVSFLLTNKLGGFLSLNSEHDNVSRYQGLHYLKERHKLMKTVDLFRINKDITGIRHNFSSVERLYDDVIERFTYIDNSNSISYEVENSNDKLIIQLDTREIYDFDDEGREFTFSKEDDSLIIRYKKTQGNKKYKSYICIKGIEKHKILPFYVEQDYEFDRKRNTNPNKWWAFEGIEIPVNEKLQLLISCGDDLDEIKKESNSIYPDLNNKLDIKKSHYVSTLRTDLKLDDEEIKFAYLQSLNSVNELSNLIDGKRGMYAGLWWFFHWWARDEAISSISLLISKHYLYAKEILLRQIDTIFEDGRAPNIFPNEGTGSADGVGWTFKRLHDLILKLKKENLDQMYFSESDYILILDRLEKSIEGHVNKYRKHGFFESGHNETWMDTVGDGRNGARIEIQSLILHMYNFASYLSKLIGENHKSMLYKKLHKEFKGHIKEFFFSGFELADGIQDRKVDFTMRPNIFLAYYLTPELLEKHEWEKCFDIALEKLTVEWEDDKIGICSFDKTHEGFINEYSGENNISYHYGDVWYFIDNMIGTCLFRLNPSKYEEVIQKIVHTATEEILWKGIIGHHAEISSAKEFRSEASLAQLWSSATYVELIHEIHNKRK